MDGVSLQELGNFFHWDAELLLEPCIGDGADGAGGEVAGVDAEEEGGS